MKYFISKISIMKKKNIVVKIHYMNLSFSYIGKLKILIGKNIEHHSLKTSSKKFSKEMFTMELFLKSSH